MTAAELIEKLQRLDPSTVIVLDMPDSFYVATGLSPVARFSGPWCDDSCAMAENSDDFTGVVIR